MNNGKGGNGGKRDSKPADDEDIGIEDLREAAERAWRDRWGAPGKPDRTSGEDDDAPDRRN